MKIKPYVITGIITILLSPLTLIRFVIALIILTNSWSMMIISNYENQ